MNASAQTPEFPQTSLYVGDLHPSVTDAMLFQKFSEVGPLMNTRVCYDVATKDSLGYGYVNFQDPKDAERAIENLNYDLLEGRPIRIMWSHRDPSLRKSGKGNVFVKNLDKSIEQKELYDTFKYFGKILSCKIATDEFGNSKGYGFVHFASEESANTAIKKLNDLVIRDRVIYVGKFISSSERKSKGGKAKFNNCYIKNFSTELDDEWLKNLFSGYGEIKSAVIVRDETGKSKGFGFVCFHAAEDAEKAVLALNSKKLGDQNLYVTKALRKEERQEELRKRAEKQRQERQLKYNTSVNLYVKNLDETIDDDKLRDVFSQFGVITSAKVMRDQNGSRLFGFVSFQSADDATKAASEMSGVLVCSKPLYVALAQRKEERRAYLIAQHQDRLSARPALASIPAALGGSYYSYQQRLYNNMITQPRWIRPQMALNITHPAMALNASAVAAGQPRVAATHFGLPAAGASASQLHSNAAALGANLGHMAGVNAALYRAQPHLQQQQQQQHIQLQQQNAMAAAAAAAAATNRNLIHASAAPIGPQVTTTGLIPGVQMASQLPNQLTSVPHQRAHLHQLQQQPRSVAASAMQVTGVPLTQHVLAQSQAAGAGQSHTQAPAVVSVLSQANQPRQQHMLPPSGAPPPRPSAAEIAAAPPGSLRMAVNNPGMMPNQQPGIRFNNHARNLTHNQVVVDGNSLAQGRQDAERRQMNQMNGLTPMVGDNNTLSLSSLAQMTEETRKVFLGNKLYPLIQKKNPDLVGKLTGMLLEMETGDVIHMLESSDALDSKLEEAKAILQERVKQEDRMRLAASSNAANNLAEGTQGVTSNAVNQVHQQNGKGGRAGAKHYQANPSTTAPIN